MTLDGITLRRATDGDVRTLEALAELDSQRLPADEFLIGEVAGVAWAALGITTGILVADPYRPTAELAELLRLRVQRTTPPGEAARRGRRRWRPRAVGV